MTNLAVGMAIKVNHSNAVKAVKTFVDNVKAVSVKALKAATDIKNYGTAVNKIKGKVRSAIDATKKWIAKLKATGANADYLKEKINKLSSRLKLFAAGAAIGGAALFGGAVNEAIKFESVMADVKKVVDFETPQQFKQMQDDILKLSTKIPMAAEGLGDIVAAAGQAGIKRHELMTFANDAAKIGVAFDITGKEAGSALTGIRTIFKLNQKDAVELAGTYNYLSNSMDATAKDIMNVNNRAGNLAMSVGLTGKQLAAMGATMLAQKHAPEVVSTALNSMLVKLGAIDKQGMKFHGALSELGISSKKFKADMADNAEKAITNLFKTIKAQGKDASGIMTDLFGAEHAPKLLSLVNGVDQYANAQKLAGEHTKHTNSILAEYEARSKTTENSLTLLKNQVKKVGIEFGSAFLPMINDAVKDLTPTIEFISLSVRQLFSDTTAETPQWIIGLKVIFYSFTPVIEAVKTGFKSLWTTISGDSGNAKGQTSDFVEIAASLGEKIRGLAPIVTTLFNVLTPVVSVLIDIVSFAAKSGFIELTIGVIAGIKAFMGLKRAITGIKLAFMAMKGLVATNPILLAVTVIAGLAYLIYNNWSGIKAFFIDVFGKAGDYITQKWTEVKDWFFETVDSIKAIFIKNWENGVIPILLGPVGIVIRYWSQIKGFFNKLIQGIQLKFQEGKDLIVQSFISLKTKALNALNSLFNFFKSAPGKAKIAFVELTAKVKTLFLEMVLYILKKLEVIPFFGDQFKGLGKDIEKSIKKINADKQTKIMQIKMSQATKAMKTDIHKTASLASQIFNKLDLKSKGQKMIQTFANGIKSKDSYLKGVLNSVLNKSVKRQMPSSNAKEGPLSNLTGHGKGFITAFSQGISSNAGILKGTIAQSFSDLNSGVTFKAHNIEKSKEPGFKASPTPQTGGNPQQREMKGSGDTNIYNFYFGDKKETVESNGQSDFEKEFIELMHKYNMRLK